SKERNVFVLSSTYQFIFGRHGQWKRNVCNGATMVIRERARITMNHRNAPDFIYALMEQAAFFEEHRYGVVEDFLSQVAPSARQKAEKLVAGYIMEIERIVSKQNPAWPETVFIGSKVKIQFEDE